MPITRSRSSVLTLAAVGVALLAPSPAQATDDEVRAAVNDGAVRIVKQERKVVKVAKRFSGNQKPTLKLVRRFRAAAREEADVARDIRRDLLAADADSDDVGRGRDLMAAGLREVATGLDRIDTTLGKLIRGGSSKAARRAIKKAQREIASGNRSIDDGEPLVGAELTPGTASEGTPS